MPIDAAKLGDALRKVRIERELTLQEVFEATGISVATLSRIERSAFANVKSETMATLNEWIARDGEEIETPDIVELHLRADKKLNKKTADALANLFRSVYEQLTEDMNR